MTTTIRSSSHESGVTLTELLVVILVIAALSSFALMRRGSASEQLNRQNAAHQLKTFFERARFDSVKRRAECDSSKAKVVVDTNSFAVWVDKNLDGTPAAGEAENATFSGQNITFAGVSFVPPITVSFNQRGEVTATDGTTTSTFPQFLVCNGSCPDPPTNSHANKVYVTPTGTVNLLGGSQSPPTFGVPGGTAVGTGAEIDGDMILSTSSGCS